MATELPPRIMEKNVEKPFQTSRPGHTLYIITGSPAVGKTTYGRKLARELHAAFLDIDTCTERLVMTGLSLANEDTTDRDSAKFKSAFRDPIYESLFDIAADNIGVMDVIIVGPFTKELTDPLWPDKVARRFCAMVGNDDNSSVRVCVHFLYCSPSVRRERMIQRGNPRDASKLEDWKQHDAYYSEAHVPLCPHVFVDTTQRS